jgi:hypothetical protein
MPFGANRSDLNGEPRQAAPAFRKDGTIRAGNVPGLNSGAAAGEQGIALDGIKFE